MIDFGASSTLPLKEGDILQPMNEIHKGDIVCFQKISEGCFGLKTLTPDESSHFLGDKYLTAVGGLSGMMKLILVPPANEFKKALLENEDEISDNYLGMLRAHYLAKNHTISASHLAEAVGFSNYNAANLRYGLLAKKVGDLLSFHPDGCHTSVLATEGEKPSDEAHWQWKMRPELVQAISDLGWFDDELALNPVMDVEAHEDSLAGLSDTEREIIVKSRVGQGRFRESLIEFWHQCVVTACKEKDLLRASHIKPWRYSDNKERLCVYNGLLLTPNLDMAFDLGFISFREDGSIMLSPRLSYRNADALGIHEGMKLCFVAEQHQPYLKYHRDNIFKTGV